MRPFPFHRARGVATPVGIALRANPKRSGSNAPSGPRHPFNGRQFGIRSESDPYLAERPAAFTLLEVVLASMAAAIILLAIYGIFQHALRLRDGGDRRIRATRLRARAETVIRNDLQNALVSGGILAATFSGDSSGTDTSNLTGAGAGSFPGYFKFTTTTGRDTSAELYGDVQQVEYYIIPDPAAPPEPGNAAGGILVRAITRDLLDALDTTGSAQASYARQEQILAGVQSFQVSFYDGANWQTSWQFTGLSTTASGANPTPTPSTGAASTSTLNGETGLPDAVRIDIQQAPATPRDSPPPPLEVLVPWTTQPFAAATPATSTGTAATPTPTPTATAAPAPHAAPPAAAPPAAGGKH